MMIMREAELLNALAKAKPGVQIFIRTTGMVTVGLCYAPYVVGVGPTLFLAARDCALWLLDVAKTNPDYREQLPEVFAALEAYDNHLEALQV
jgi:hypothetical protein